MNVLTNIYDGRVFHEVKRTNKIENKIKAPQINLIAATTPSYLSQLIPEGAWDQGFMSRVMLIYGGNMPPSDLFAIKQRDASLFDKLAQDLKVMSDIYGGFTLHPEAREAFTAWHLAGNPPYPEHPRLHNYATRRSAHLLKLAMAISISYSDDLVITLENYVEALDILLETEAAMPEIFKAMRTGGDMALIEEAYHFVYEAYMKGGREPISEHRLQRFLSEHTPAHNIVYIINAMKSAKLIEEKAGKSIFGIVPGDKREI